MSYSYAFEKVGAGAAYFYVMEARTAPNRKIQDFLYQLACQGINELFLIVLTETQELCTYTSGMDSRINLITTPDFLMGVSDIQSGYTQNGIPLSMEEAALIFQCTNGWAPLVSKIFHRIKQNGKHTLWRSIGHFSDCWDANIERPEQLGYSLPLRNLLTRMSLTDAFTLADVEQIDRDSGGLLSCEMPAWKCLDVDDRPALLYYDDITGLYHPHWLLRCRFLKAFEDLPVDEQVRLRAAHAKLHEGNIDISNELHKTCKLLFALREEEAAERVRSLKLKEPYISSRDQCCLLIVESFAIALQGHAQNAVANLEKEYVGRCETGAFYDGKQLILGSLFLRCCLGGTYAEALNGFAEELLYTDLFQEVDAWHFMPWLRSIILLHGDRMAELETVMEMTQTYSEEAEAIRCFFLALARTASDQQMHTAIRRLANVDCRLPLVFCYGRIIEYLQKYPEEEKEFLNGVKSVVNHYGRHILANRKTGADVYSTRLTRRQMEAAKLAAAGLSNKEIAQQMGVSLDTVKTTLRQVFQKLQINHRRELISLDLNHTIVTP